MFKFITDMNTKKKEIPNGEVQEVTVVDTWSVRWTSRKGEYSSDTEPRVEVFVSEEEAYRFKEELQKAHSLIGNIGEGTIVRVVKNN